MMKKSLLALSVAAAAMGAQAADVQVYGLIDTSLSFVSSDADIAGHDRVNSFSMENAKEFGSRFGLKGSEDLGNGYKVAFVLESGIKSDDGSLDQGGKLFGREAHVDLVGPFGKLSAGLMPVFGSTLGADGLFRAIDPLFANYTKAFGSGHVTASSWTRVDNALSYVSPDRCRLHGLRHVLLQERLLQGRRRRPRRRIRPLRLSRRTLQGRGS